MARQERSGVSADATRAHPFLGALKGAVSSERDKERGGMSLEKLYGSKLAEQALTHKSWSVERDGADDNERLEFLGDAVLELVVTNLLFNDHDSAEGVMAKTRADVVCTTSLAGFAREMGIPGRLLLGGSEEATGGRHKPKLLADAFEALVGAYFVEHGLKKTEAVLRPAMLPKLKKIVESGVTSDFKTRLQERAVALCKVAPTYKTSGVGPDHDRRFTSAVSLRGTVIGTGTGRSKKGAEQSAARKALHNLK